MRRATVLVLAACCALLLQMPARAAPPVLKARFLGMPLEEAEKGNEICVSGVVTYVFPGSGGDFVLADVDHPNGFGLYVRNAVAEVSVGDVVTVAGVTCVENYRAAVRALSVAVSGSVELPSAPAIRVEGVKGKAARTLFGGGDAMAHNSSAEPEALKESVSEIDFDGTDALPPLSLAIYRFP